MGSNSLLHLYAEVLVLVTPIEPDVFDWASGGQRTHNKRPKARIHIEHFTVYGPRILTKCLSDDLGAKLKIFIRMILMHILG